MFIAPSLPEKNLSFVTSEKLARDEGGSAWEALVTINVSCLWHESILSFGN